MQMKEKMQQLLIEQKEFLKGYESLVKEFDSSDMVNQNIELLKEIEKCRNLIEEIKMEHQKTLNENQNLKVALKEQILDEKLNILKISKAKMNVYFKDMSDESTNRLSALEQKAKQQLEEFNYIASKELGIEHEEFHKEAEKLFADLQRRIKQRKDNFASSINGALKDIEGKIDELGSEGVSEEVIKRRIKQNDFEIKIGLNWINKIGIFLILLGVGFGLKYTYTNAAWFTKEMKGILVFLIGALFLFGGEWLNRKEKNIFALGLVSCGVGVLYLAIFNSYFVLDIINMQTGILLSVLVTIVALVLSLRYNSKTICSFALVGGYLPFFTYVFVFGLNNTGLYISMGYLFLLNLLILLISMYKKWDIVNYISFLLNIPTLAYLAMQVPSEAAGILYSVVTFLMYLFIVIIYPFKNKMSLKVADIILLALNTFINCILIYILFDSAGLKSYTGLLALLFCLIYLGLGQFMGRYLKEEKVTQLLFYLTSFTFAILVIPFQFGVRWLTMGWLVEGVLLAIFGFKYKFRKVEIGGWIIFGLCAATFFMIDVLNTITGGAGGAGAAMPFTGIKVAFFDFKYTSVIAGLLCMLFIYLYDMKKDAIKKYSTRGELITVLKYFAVINLWIYVIYMDNLLYNKLLYKYTHITDYSHFYKSMLFAFTTILTAYVVSKIPVLVDKFIKYYSIILYSIANLICIYINLAVPVYTSGNDVPGYLPITILLAFNVFAFFSVRDLSIALVKKKGISLEIYPLFMSIYLMGNITGLLIVQFRLGNVNLLFSLLYLIFALAFIVFGFKKKYVIMRRFGLGLSVFSTAKLFIFDLSHLDAIGRIIAYFGFGIVMLAISYIYQRLKKTLDLSNNSIKMG